MDLFDNPSAATHEKVLLTESTLRYYLDALEYIPAADQYDK